MLYKIIRHPLYLGWMISFWATPTLSAGHVMFATFMTLYMLAAIPIEERPGEEMTHGFGRQTAPSGIKVYNPAFDVTPARLIEAIICEHGVIRPVTAGHIASTLGNR